MALEDFQGEWSLIESAAAQSEIEITDDSREEPEGVSAWLNGGEGIPPVETRKASGLLLSIAADGSFAENVSGSPDVEWFDAEGVLALPSEGHEIVPFSGMLVPRGQEGYLRPAAVVSWAVPNEGQYGSAVLRFDDGSTKIADHIKVVGGRLVRTVSVVTDWLYLHRTFMVYERDRPIR